MRSPQGRAAPMARSAQEVIDDTATDARVGRERRHTLPWADAGGDADARGNPADAARPIRADTNEWLRVFWKLPCLGHHFIAGLQIGDMALPIVWVRWRTRIDDRNSPALPFDSRLAVTAAHHGRAKSNTSVYPI